MSNALALLKMGGDLATMDYGEDANLGYENTTLDDFKTPFLKPQQPLSPAVIAGDARPGQILNTGSGQAFDAVGFVAACTQQSYIKWKLVNGKRVNSGGFMGTFSTEDPMVLKILARDGKYAKHITDDGHQLVQTFYVYGIGIDLETSDSFPAIVAFSSTGVDYYRVWRALAERQKYTDKNGERKIRPLPSYVYKLTTQQKQNDQGTFWNIQAAFATEEAKDSFISPKHPLFIRAKEIYKQFASGELKVDHEQATAVDAQAGRGGGGGGGNRGPMDEEIPF